MNILIVAGHYCVCSARYATEAFQRLGHSVRHVGPAMGRNIWGLTLPERYVWEPDPELQLGQYHSGWLWADLAIVMDSDPAILDAANSIPVPRVVWGLDNHVRDYRRLHFDHYFLAHRNVSVMNWAIPGNFREDPMGREYTHLPCCYDPTVFTPSTIPWAEREYDVAMIGVMYEQRQQAVQALRAAGLKVLAGTGLVYENMAAAYQNARISLCLSSNGDVGQRVFESAACGCVVLSDPLPDMTPAPTNGIVTFNGIDDMVEKAQSLRTPGGETYAINALQWVKPHTWDARAQVIIDWAEARNEV